jgi:hypothetical protein
MYVFIYVYQHTWFPQNGELDIGILHAIILHTYTQLFKYFYMYVYI